MEDNFDLKARQAKQYGRRHRLSLMAQIMRETFPRLHFFYRHLMDEALLSKVLGLARQPEIRPAYVSDFRIMLSGAHPALVTEAGYSTKGAIYEFQSLEDAQILQDHDPKNHAPQETGNAR